MCSHAHNLAALPYQSTRFTGIGAVKERLRRQTQNSALDISLDHHYTNKVYNSGSLISGELFIKPKYDVPFDEVRISLVGRCRVRQEDVNNTSLNLHTFLTLDMQISPSVYPVTGVFHTGVAHAIPFHFVVPLALLPTACSHPIECESARSHHACLPPTMGDWEKDDMAPNMTNIKYEVVARVLQNDPSVQGSTGVKKVLEARRSVRILSSSLETVSFSDIPKKSQNVSKTKAIRKMPFSKPSGNVTLRAGQTTTICLSQDAREATPSLITVDAEFDSKDPEVSPPKIDKIVAKLHAHTWYSGTPMPNFPDQHPISKQYSTSSSLGVEYTDDSSWILNCNALPTRDRDENQQHKSYTRALQIVLTPPMREKTILPTFHSCLISRTYKIALTFRFNRETVTLEIPVRIQAEAEDYRLEEENLPSFEEAMHFVS